MDLGAPLRTLIPSLDSAVLEVLARVEQPQSASAIWRASSRGTRPGQQPILNRLVESGLVEASPSAAGRLYALNREHILAEAILSATTARARLVDRLKSRLNSIDPRPVHASLFGSFARGEADDDSDIDLLLVVAANVDPRSPAWTREIDALADDVERWTGNSLQPLTYTVHTLHRLAAEGEPIVQYWREEGIHLQGQALESLVDRTPAA